MPRRVILIAFLLAQAALAGGGPETTLVVVNAESPSSRRVANAYTQLREIHHVVYLDEVPPRDVIKLDEFLEKIWKPIQAYMDARGIADQIELITYSAGLPYAVDFSDRDKQKFARASFTGLTYLIRQVEAGEDFWNLQINDYYGLEFQGAPRRATMKERGFAMRANQAMQAKRYADAADAFASLLATYKESANSWYNYACCLARLGKKKTALEALAKAAEAGFADAAHTAKDPDLASLRNTPRFQGVLRRMGEVKRAGVQAKLKPSRASTGRYLSTRLGYTGRYGNSVPEILAYLRSAAAADGTRPGGTVYICKNGNVRSTAREPFFPLLIGALEERGRKVELLDKTVLPQGKDDVFGAVVGSAGFSWAKSKSKILPGAIVEHLTSHGANFGTPGQTKISEFLRHGAAGSSGTVAEPYAIHQKFPNPAIHVFYADGCSLAESYFQSVWGPYQLMIVGDGLTQPFARVAKVETRPLVSWRDLVRPTVKAPPGTARIEVWAAGRRVATAKAGELLAVDSTKLHDGYLDVRIVAVADGPVATRSYARHLSFVNNRNRKVEIQDFNPQTDIRVRPELVIRADGASMVRLVQGSRVLATAADGRLTLAGAPVGPGRFTVVPEVIYPDGSIYRCRPVIFDLDPPDPQLAASAELPENARTGLVGDGRVFVTSIGDRRAGLRLRDHVAKGPVTLEGFLEIPSKGVYELVATGTGPLRVTVTGESVFDGELAGRAYLSLSRDKGWHSVRIECARNLELMLGGAQVLAPLALRHAPPPALEQQPKVAKKLASLRDGELGGAGVAIDELVLRWTRAVQVGAVTLYPREDPTALASGATIETSSGYGKWRPVKDLQLSIARPPWTAKGEKEIPLFVELRFAPVRAKKLRLRLKSKVAVAEFELHGARK